MNDRPDPSSAARRAIVDKMLVHVPFDGWTRRSLVRAVRDAELPDGADELYFSGGPLEALRLWSEMLDAAAEQRLAQSNVHNMRIRDKVTQAVLARMEAIGPHQEAARRAISRLALPDAAGQGPAQLWRSADTIWRALGDTSTDGNYYSKRLILSGVIGSSLLSWLGDNSQDKNKAREFLDARIGDVMKFETVKRQVKKRTDSLPHPGEILGRLRYGRRRRRRRS